MNAPDPLPSTADGALPAGHRLGHFEVRGILATGENDVVYRAWDVELGIAVAIKEYLPRRLVRRNASFGVEALDVGAGVAFEGGREAFLDEARLLARCDDHSLLRVRHLLRAHGTVYRVMPLYSGWRLLDLRREMDAPPDEPALRRLLLELLDALASWHRVAGAHGGIDPARILLLDDDRALLLGPRAVRPDPVDTPHLAAAPPVPGLAERFLAPELRAPAADRPTGPWSDFFALAQVARFCITGLLPSVPGASPVEPLVALIRRRTPDEPVVRYAETLLGTLDAAASPDIARRPRTVGEFREWLQQGPPRQAPEPIELAPARRVSVAPDPAHPASVEPDWAHPTSIDPDSAHAAVIAAPAFAAAAVVTPSASEPAAQTPTIGLIRRAIESVPERDEAPAEQAQAARSASPAPGPAPVLAERPVREGIGPALGPTAWPPRRPSRRPWWLAAATLLLAAVGYGAADEGWWPLWRGEPLGDAQPAAWVGAAPPATVTVAPLRIAEVTAELSGQGVATATPAMQTASPSAAAVEQAPSPVPADAGASAPAARAVEAPAAEAPAAPPAPSPAAADAAPDSVPAPAPAPVPAAAPAKQAPRSAPDSPRQVCGDRTPFSLYRCMQQQCATAAWKQHAQCVQLSVNDRVD